MTYYTARVVAEHGESKDNSLVDTASRALSTSGEDWSPFGNNTDILVGDAAGDQFGWSTVVSADGLTLAVGARYNDNNGSNAGCVKIYRIVGNSWSQVGEDIYGEAADDRFGDSVSLSADGKIVAIGAHGNDGNGNDSGHVRVYRNRNDSWSQVGADIDGESAGDISGISVSLSADGKIVAIGARGNDDNGNAAGHVRVYQYRKSSSWTQLGDDIDGAAVGDSSGRSVSLSGDGKIVAIGAHGNDGTNGIGAGHVRVYQFSDDSWTQIGDDIDSDAAGDISGISVSLSADEKVVAIGTYYNDDNGIGAGHIRVYQYSIGSWSKVGDDIDSGAARDSSGRSVSLSADGKIVAHGANPLDTTADHVKVYQFIDKSWTQIGDEIGGEAHGRCTVSLSADGGIVAVGNYKTNAKAGSVRIYERVSE